MQCILEVNAVPDEGKIRFETKILLSLMYAMIKYEVNKNV